MNAPAQTWDQQGSGFKVIRSGSSGLQRAVLTEGDGGGGVVNGDNVLLALT